MAKATGIFCRSCGYDLQALSENRCPECGRAFDPNQRRSYDLKPRRAALSRWLWRFALLLLLAGATIAGMITWTWRGYERDQKALERLGHFGIIRKELAPMPVIERLLPERYQYLRTRVWSVCLGSKQLTEQDWEMMRRLDYLRDGRFGSLPDGDDVVQRVAALRGLTFLQIGGKNITDDDLARLAEVMPKLETLYLTAPNITDKGIEGLSNSKSIQTLTLSHCDISDQALVALGRMASLKKLLLSEKNDVSDEAIARLRAARPDLKVTRLQY